MHSAKTLSLLAMAVLGPSWAETHTYVHKYTAMCLRLTSGRRKLSSPRLSSQWALLCLHKCSHVWRWKAGAHCKWWVLQAVLSPAEAHQWEGNVPWVGRLGKLYPSSQNDLLCDLAHIFFVHLNSSCSTCARSCDALVLLTSPMDTTVRDPQGWEGGGTVSYSLFCPTLRSGTNEDPNLTPSSLVRSVWASLSCRRGNCSPACLVCLSTGWFPLISCTAYWSWRAHEALLVSWSHSWLTPLWTTTQLPRQ